MLAATVGCILGLMLFVLAVDPNYERTGPGPEYSFADNPYIFQFGFIDIEVHGAFCQIDLALQGDLAYYRGNHRSDAWSDEVLGSWGAFAWEIRKSYGTPRQGRMLRVFVETWWLLAALFLPSFWLYAIHARDARPRISAQMWRRRPVRSSLALLSLLVVIMMSVWWSVSYDGAAHERYYRFGDWRISCVSGELAIRRGSESLASSSPIEFRLPGFHSYYDEFAMRGMVYSMYQLILHPLYVLAAGSILPWRWQQIRMREMKVLSQGCCRNCGYDMRASGDACPECGGQRQA